MRGIILGVLLLGVQASAAKADEETDRVLGGVLSGLLGTPQQSPDALYTAKERERLAAFLQSGEYATSRQGEPIDLVVHGIPLTRSDRVYTARPIQPSPTSDLLNPR